MKVFISGSASRKSLSDKDKSIIRSLIKHNDEILVGDCQGIDTAVQTYIRELNYTCTVYHAGYKCRNNVGNFPTKRIDVHAQMGPREFYTQKDIAMTDDCDAGIVFWDGVSAGSIRNADRLKHMDKPVRVYTASQYATATAEISL